MEVRYDGVRKQFGSVHALHELDLDIADGEFLALLGSSGCGKTTTLRILAGLERPTAGRVFIGERDITDLAPKDRDIAMVFQSYALYPHMSVAENIGYPLKIRKVSRADRREVIDRVAKVLNLSETLDRRPRELSGGQRQRVALARAIVRHPSVFLMDEPLSNLDAILRVHMRGELKRLQRDLGVTTVYVTHDQSEAMTMADRVAVMCSGRLEQLGPPRELYERPANRFVASFVGSPAMNLLEVDIESNEMRIAGVEGAVPMAPEALSALERRGTGRKLELGVRPEHIEAVSEAEPGLDCEVYSVQQLDHEVLVTFALGGCRVTGRFDVERQFTMGAPARLSFNPRRLHYFSMDDGGSLLATSDIDASPAGEQEISPQPVLEQR